AVAAVGAGNRSGAQSSPARGRAASARSPRGNGARRGNPPSHGGGRERDRHPWTPHQRDDRSSRQLEAGTHHARGTAKGGATGDRGQKIGVAGPARCREAGSRRQSGVSLTTDARQIRSNSREATTGALRAARRLLLQLRLRRASAAAQLNGRPQAGRNL